MNRKGLLAVVTVLAVLLVGARAGDARAQAEVEYVALGDSYTAGPFIPSQVGEPSGCRRSDRNYPQLVAAALGWVLRDASCSGATTADLLSPQSVPGGTNPPQLDAVGPATAVVTVGIGGNDIGFAEIVQSCLALVPLGRPCQDRFAGPNGDELSRRIIDARVSVGAVFAEIRRRAPSARVFAVGYPSVVPDQGSGCWPVMPLAFADVPYLREMQKELNAMIAEEAAAAGVSYVDVYGPSRGRDACALPGVRWIEPVVPISPAAPVHPNALGMRGMASVLVAALGGPALTAVPVLSVNLGIGPILGSQPVSVRYEGFTVPLS